MASASNGVTIIGTGIRLGQMTLEAQQAAERADVVFSVVRDDPSLAMLRSYNANVVDLKDLYEPQKVRTTTYEQIYVTPEVRVWREISSAQFMLEILSSP